jgi:hypothetical protein
MPDLATLLIKASAASLDADILTGAHTGPYAKPDRVFREVLITVIEANPEDVKTLAIIRQYTETQLTSLTHLLAMAISLGQHELHTTLLAEQAAWQAVQDQLDRTPA